MTIPQGWERNVPQDGLSIARNDDRHSHIGIRLQYRADDHWQPIEALGWNEVGFNFYNAQDIAQPLLELRRGLTRFAAAIVWRARDASDDVLMAMVVNELIFKRAKEVVNDAALQTRLLKLIRFSGMVAEKRKILDSLGATNITDTRIAELMAHKKLEPPMYHYGVKVQSEAWVAIVQSALSVSSVLVSLEKWSDSLTKN